jgi:hypothetical protein
VNPKIDTKSPLPDLAQAIYVNTRDEAVKLRLDFDIEDKGMHTDMMFSLRGPPAATPMPPAPAAAEGGMTEG